MSTPRSSHDVTPLAVERYCTCACFIQVAVVSWTYPTVTWVVHMLRVFGCLQSRMRYPGRYPVAGDAFFLNEYSFAACLLRTNGKITQRRCFSSQGRETKRLRFCVCGERRVVRGHSLLRGLDKVEENNIRTQTRTRAQKYVIDYNRRRRSTFCSLSRCPSWHKLTCAINLALLCGVCSSRRRQRMGTRRTTRSSSRWKD